MNSLPPYDLKAIAAQINTAASDHALGMNYRNPRGRRGMLWPQDADEFALNGRTANGSRIAGAQEP